MIQAERLGVVQVGLKYVAEPWATGQSSRQGLVVAAKHDDIEREKNRVIGIVHYADSNMWLQQLDLQVV